MIYFILSLISTTIGAVVGIGGGLIIRPVLAFMGIDKGAAAFTAAVTVLSMAIVNLILHKKNGSPFHFRQTLFLAIGSILGGFLGGGFIPLVSERFINIAYIFAVVLVLLVVTFRSKLPRFRVKNPVLSLFIGAVTGVLSGFFGIGGGPFQMAALLMFFDLDPKDAAVQSIFITALTTLSSIGRYALSGTVDFSLAVFMIPAAIVGGFVGSKLNRKLTNRQITSLFNLTVLAIVALQIYTVFFK